MQSAYLIDGGFFHRVLTKQMSWPCVAADVTDFVSRFNQLENQNAELLRIYFYDSPPFNGTEKQPVSGVSLDFSKSNTYRQRARFLADLKHSDFVSVREGALVFHGWRLKKAGIRKLQNQSGSLADEDYAPDLQQKGVDIKIGLDIAWLALERIVHRIILVTGDSDLIPAMKFARRHGIQVFLATLGHGVARSTKDDADRLIERSLRDFLA